MTIHHTACILCSRVCGITIEVEGNQFKKIRGDEACPSSKGYICQKAARLTHYQSHPDRLTRPLKKMADGQFVAVSWDQALSEIAAELKRIKAEYGGKAFALYGGGGQANHLGAAYSNQILATMGSRYRYNAMAQEKTGDFWVNGKMFGKQSCHTTEDVEHADFLLVIGANPYQAHGIPSARDTLKHIKNDPQRTLVVIDPRRTETAKMADIHLQLRPGTDAWLMAAMLSIIVREGLHDESFLRAHCHGFDELKVRLLNVPVEEYIGRADVPPDDVYKVARGYATAARACLRIDLGIQQTLNSTLNSYLEKLLFLVTGNFGKQGGNNLHASLLPVLSHQDENKPGTVRTVHNNMFPIGGVYPPSILPSEINNANPERVRALLVDSGNPANTIADTRRMLDAFERLDLLVVVDVAMTETAQHADYVLPARSQFEKCEATGFTLEFPENYFQLRHPIATAPGEALPEAEIYTRLLEHMGVLPRRFPVLEAIARHQPEGSQCKPLLMALMATLKLRPKLQRCAPSILYRTLGKMLGERAAAAVLLPLCLQFAARHTAAVERTGLAGSGHQLGMALFDKLLDNPQGIVVSRHRYEDVWQLLATPDKKVNLAPPELLKLLSELRGHNPDDTSERYPLVLMAGERRSYNANQIYRDPQWRKQDPHGALRIHPADAVQYGLSDGGRALCESATGAIEVVVEFDTNTRPGFASLPHGYGMSFNGSAPLGPQLNRLTASERCDPITKTPYHKYVPVNLKPVLS